MPITSSGKRQQEHYQEIHGDYGAHYYDAPSLAYRDRFILPALLQGLDLRNRRVADIASGAGYTSLALMRLFPGIEPEGFDISPAACAEYEKLVGRPAHRVDLVKPFAVAEPFDAAIVIGGLHHCVEGLDTVIANLAALIKTGGFLLLYEPNETFLLQGLRTLWYKMDRYFDAETEAALNHDELLARASSAFALQSLRYLGGPAYFLILNSLILRIPRAWKSPAMAPLFAAETMVNKLPGRRLFPAFAAQWVRRDR